MRILILATSYNGLTQRVHKELVKANHQISIELSSVEQEMIQTVFDYEPTLVVCPFLKHRIPDVVWQKVPCLVFHPGVAGDRGPSSLDWAVNDRLSFWGGTLLQANHEFDAGEIWGSAEFPMRNTSKASLYRREVTQIAAKLILDTVSQLSKTGASERHDSEHIVGSLTDRWRPLIKQSDRKINWLKDSGEMILAKINAADSFPGVKDTIFGVPVFLYGAQFESTKLPNAKPGDIVGRKDESICRATKDGLIWIKQLKLALDKEEPCQLSRFKLPAMRLVSQLTDSELDIPVIQSTTQSDIISTIEGSVSYLTFDFYNGALNTEQCIQLLNEFKIITANPKIKVIVLLGGNDFWCNGIHLNCIEDSDDPANESWRNINAINDLVKAIINCTSALTVAALRNNAGAGGAIIPLACDYIVARDGVVLNPHYQTMGLTGSEYWTFLLPKRVGVKNANALMQECLPILASDALEMGYLDEVFSEDWTRYHRQLFEFCKALSISSDYKDLLENKKSLRVIEEAQRPLAQYRRKELKKMKQIFDDPFSDYHKLRSDFVNKIGSDKTPSRLVGYSQEERSEALAVG